MGDGEYMDIDWWDIMLNNQLKLFNTLRENYEKTIPFSDEYLKIHMDGGKITERALQIEKIAGESMYIPSKCRFRNYERIDGFEFDPKVILIGYVDTEHLVLKKILGTMTGTLLSEDSSSQIEKIILQMEKKGVITKQNSVLRFEGMKKLYDFFKKNGFNCEYTCFEERDMFEKKAEANEKEYTKLYKNGQSPWLRYRMKLGLLISHMYNKRLIPVLRNKLAESIAKHVHEGKYVIQAIPLQDITEAHHSLIYPESTKKLQWISLAPFKLKPST